jgi:hypothetical protein
MALIPAAFDIPLKVRHANLFKRPFRELGIILLQRKQRTSGDGGFLETPLAGVVLLNDGIGKGLEQFSFGKIQEVFPEPLKTPAQM